MPVYNNNCPGGICVGGLIKRQIITKLKIVMDNRIKRGIKLLLKSNYNLGWRWCVYSIH